MLQDFWFLTAAKDAGIDVTAWDISKGAYANQKILELSYTYYGKLFLGHPELQWAGLAQMVGAGFAASFFDLDLMGQVADAASKVPGSPVGPIGGLSEHELTFYETTFLTMQRNIFTDMGGMHQAYVDGGMPAIAEMRAAGLIDERTYRAWQATARYATMDPSDPAAQRLISRANYDMAYREQGRVIGGDYDRMREHAPSGPAFTYVAGLVGSPSIPGARSPAQYDPLHVTVPVLDANLGPWDLFSVDADVTTPLPRTNVSVFEDRMDLLRNDTLPAYEKLLRSRGVDGLVADWLITDDTAVMAARIRENRLSHRIDDILAQLANWDVDVDGRLGG